MHMSVVGVVPQQLDQMNLLMQLASMTSTRFEQVRVVKEWLLPALRQYLSRFAFVTYFIGRPD
jgi:hypothetical protein